MLNDWYQAIIDTQASREQAKELAIAAASSLAEAKIITLYKPSHSSTHITGKFAPGPLFSYLSGTEIIDTPYMNNNIGGMDVCTDPWINDYGIIGMDSAVCPECFTDFTSDNYEKINEIREAFVRAGENFLNNKPPHIICPACGNGSTAHKWRTQPHLGFCHFTLLFWNWPPFDNWKVDVLGIVSETINRNAILTYGRL